MGSSGVELRMPRKIGADVDNSRDGSLRQRGLESRGQMEPNYKNVNVLSRLR